MKLWQCEVCDTNNSPYFFTCQRCHCPEYSRKVGGKVETKDGEFKDFDDWYQEKFDEEPTRQNIRKRLDGAK
jgi:hypothetical protein